MERPLTYISLFSSAGVGCFGFQQNGFHCIATNELLEKRLKIQRYNKKCPYDTGYVVGDISDKDVKSKIFKELDFWKQKHKLQELDVVLATPPCQGMSVANHKKKNERQRNSLVVESIKITKETLPKFFIFENVRTFLSTTCTDTDGIDKPIKEAINLNLGGYYNILYKIINFKNYGANSSRNRTLVIGVRKDVQNVSPFDIFPKKRKPQTLRQLIGDLPKLKKMGEISKDIYHSYREFDPQMLPWIKNLKEGQSAFENTDKKKIPHRVVNRKVIFNKSKNGDKYARWYWDKEGPCIHTRNDILASQNTIHPQDNRVFSIRELMLMMTIPEKFEWSSTKYKALNKLTKSEKKDFLKKEELNIRHCIGEAVPTTVINKMACNIKNVLKENQLTYREVNKLVDKLKLNETKNLIKFIKSNKAYSLTELFLIAELSNQKRQHTAAYFTRQDVVFTLIKDLPTLSNKKRISILEPSVGVGNFLPQIFQKYEDKECVELDVCDIEKNSIDILKILLKKMKVPKNFKIRFLNQDFLLWKPSKKYDLVIGNPPYKKLTNNKALLSLYKSGLHNTDTNNLFSFFIEKSIDIASYVSLIVPKSLINSPEFNKTRKLLEKYDIQKICDYGEKGFKGVKIETISFLLDVSKNEKIRKRTVIENNTNNTLMEKEKSYIFSKKFPYWLIYRNKKFDKIASKMKLGVFQSFRDRQITKSSVKNKGDIRVLKARNIGNNKIEEKKSNIYYIENPENYAVARYLNKNKVVMVPNLTYYPRATFLPKNTIVDGSVALLTLKNGGRSPTKKDLDFYSTKDFENYYRVARNYGTRSLNIDNNSVYFFGLLKNTSL